MQRVHGHHTLSLFISLLHNYMLCTLLLMVDAVVTKIFGAL